MESFAELRNAINNNVTIVWNSPFPIEGIDYIISHINFPQGDFLDDSEDWNDDISILVQYNKGLSEAEVFLFELAIKI
jgi:hypothetical protein